VNSKFAQFKKSIKRPSVEIIDKIGEHGWPTFISTNKSKENLNKSFDERIASRLSLFKWIGIGGADRRAKGKI